MRRRLPDGNAGYGASVGNGVAREQAATKDFLAAVAAAKPWKACRPLGKTRVQRHLCFARSV